MAQRSVVRTLAGVGLAVVAGGVAALLVFPRAFAPVALVAVIAQIVIAERLWPRSPRLTLIRRELRAHATAEQAVRVTLLTVAASAVDGRLAMATAVFAAAVLVTVRFVPRMSSRVVAARILTAALPGAQDLQGRMRILDVVSEPGRTLRATFTMWVDRLEVVVAAAVTAAVFGMDADIARWVAYVIAAVAAAVALIDLAALLMSSISRTDRQFHAQVVQSLEDYAPEYVLYFSATTSAVYQITQWLPHLISLPRRFAIITRENALVAPIAELAPGVPVIASPRLVLLDGLIVDSIRAVLYVNNGMRNAHMLRHTHLRHVQMLHGESDKAPSVNKFARAYDQLYVAGQAAVDRYALYGVQIDPAAVRVVGRPQADEVNPDLPSGRPTVLYAPTWEGWNSMKSDSSVGLLGVALVRHLIERGDVRVIVRPHPTTGLADRRLLEHVAAMRTLIERAGGDHLWSSVDGDLSLVDCFNLCTVMIADISSVMADFLRSEKALVVTDVDALGTGQFHASYPTSRAAWILRPDAGNIDEIMADVLGADSFRAARRDIRHYVLGDFDGPAEEVFHRTLAASIDDPLHAMPRGTGDVSG